MPPGITAILTAIAPIAQIVARQLELVQRAQQQNRDVTPEEIASSSAERERLMSEWNNLLPKSTPENPAQ